METAYIEVYDCREFDNAPLSGATTKSVLTGKQSAPAKSGLTTMKVQFNPSSLRFSSGESESGKERADVSYDENGRTRSASAENTSELVRVGVKLIFDRTIYEDSNVQPEVERFIAIVRNPYVRQVAFYWGTMCYRGVVKRVDAEYVLFNREGIPMRATVDFNIDVM